MRWEVAIRAIGIAAVVASYGLWLHYGTDATVFLIVITALLTLVGPEVVDSFPLGPSKPDP